MKEVKAKEVKPKEVKPKESKAKEVTMPKQPPTSPAWSFYVDHVNDWAFWNGAFTKKECEQIVEMGKHTTQQKGYIGNANAGLTLDTSIRKSDIAWILVNSDTHWIYRRLTDILNELNSKYFKFDLFGITEPLQFTSYEDDGHYVKHIDKTFNNSVRKLSVSIQLTDPSEYENGDLALHSSSQSIKMSRTQGTLIAFPSYVLHEVTPVTKGRRNSLVAWVSGPPYK
jgi:PKHD-type hydroxylase